MKQEEYRLHQGVKKWNIFFTALFAVIGSIFYYVLLTSGKLPDSITVFEFVILSLSTFRLIRLFVYDNIFLFLREAFLDKHIILHDGEKKITLVNSHSTLKRTLHKLALCPWCVGVWVSLCSFFLFYMEPNTYFLFLVLAAAGTASLIQLLSNGIGWNAEHKKIVTENLSRE